MTGLYVQGSAQALLCFTQQALSVMACLQKILVEKRTCCFILLSPNRCVWSFATSICKSRQQYAGGLGGPWTRHQEIHMKRTLDVIQSFTGVPRFGVESGS